MDDHRLLMRFRSGDPEAVRALYRRYGRAVFSVAVGALGDADLAEEAVQHTFLKAWQAAHRFNPEREAGPWLYAIARRVAVDLYRRERRHRTDRGEEHEIVALPPSFERTWEAWQVRLALEQLPLDEREVIRATHFRGLSHREAAEQLGIPLGTVKSRSHRAHRRLAGLLAYIREASA